MSGSRSPAPRKLKYIDPVSFTPHFSRKRLRKKGSSSDEILCERVSLESVAEAMGTLVYVYSRAAIESAYRELDRGLRSLPHTLCFAVQSNGHLSILNHLVRMGSGFDIVSGGELHHLQRIGGRGDRIVFSGG